MRFVDRAGSPRGGAPLLLLVVLGALGATGWEGAAQTAGLGEPAKAGAPSRLTLDSFRTPDAPCYDRSAQPQTAVVDTHVHFRPFGGPAVPFEEILDYFEATGVLFANVYGIGQMLPASSSCTYYLDCPGTPVTPTLKNRLRQRRQRRHEDAGGPAPDARHDVPGPGGSRTRFWPGWRLLDEEYPGLFRWMGEVNLVKQALFENGHEPVPAEAIAEWTGFMGALRERGMPLAIHSDLGSDDAPTRYLPLMEEVLRRYPDNAIVWVHMGLSRELTTLDPRRHVALMTSLLERHPNLMLEIAWRVIDDAYFSTPEGRATRTCRS